MLNDRSSNQLEALITVTAVASRQLPKPHRRGIQYYLSLSVDGREYQTKLSGRGERSPKWEEHFQFYANNRSTLHVMAVCGRDHGQERHVLAYAEINLLGAPRNQGESPTFCRNPCMADFPSDISFQLTNASGVDTSHQTSVVLKFKVDKGPIRGQFVVADRERQSAYNLEDLKAALRMAKTDLQRLSPQMQTMLQLLAVLGSVVEKVSGLSSKIQAAISAMNSACGLIIDQASRDDRIDGLIEIMAGLYDFLLDTNTNPLPQILYKRKVVERLIEQTRECGFFIAAYKRHKWFAQRVIANAVWNPDGLIAGFENSFGEIKIELIMGTSLQTELTTVQILEKVTNIENILHLDRLPCLRGATWNYQKICFPGTWDNVLTEIDQWISWESDDPSGQIYLLLGPPRCGKTSIAHAVAQRYAEQRRLGSAVILTDDIEQTITSMSISGTLARELADYHSVMKEAVSSALQKDFSLASADIDRQFQKLIVDGTEHLTIVGPVLIVIDGVDKCVPSSRPQLLRTLARETQRLPPNFRILLTSRTGLDIEDAFSTSHNCTIRTISYSEAGDKQDIQTCISEALVILRATKAQLFEEHPVETVSKTLTERAMGIPLWATMACKTLLCCKPDDAAEFLSLIMSPFPSWSSHEEAFDDLFNAIIKSVVLPHRATRWDAVFNVLAKSRVPISLSTLKRLSWLHPNSAHHPIETLFNIGCLVQRPNHEEMLCLTMQRAFQDFITDSRRCPHKFCVDLRYPYLPCFAEECIDSMMKLFPVVSPSLQTRPYNAPKLTKETIPEELQHSSIHWIPRVLEIGPEAITAKNLLKISRFLDRHLAHWVRLMDAIGRLDSVLALEDFCMWLNDHVPSMRREYSMAQEGLRLAHKIGNGNRSFSL